MSNRSSGITLLEAALRTRTTLDSALSYLPDTSETYDDEVLDTASVSSYATFRSAASIARADRAESVASRSQRAAPGTSALRTTFIPLTADSTASLGGNFSSLDSPSTGGVGDRALSLDLGSVRRGLSQCTTMPQVLDILNTWLFPMNAGQEAGRAVSSGTIASKSPAIRFGRVIDALDMHPESTAASDRQSNGFEVLWSEFQEGGSSSIAAQQPMTIVLQGAVCSSMPYGPSLSSSVSDVLLRLEPGLSTRRRVQDWCEVALARADRTRLTALALEAVAATCSVPAVVTCTLDPDLSPPPLCVSVSVGRHRGEGRAGHSAGHGAGLTCVQPFVFLVRSAESDTGIDGASAGHGRLLVNVVLRVAFSGVNTASTSNSQRRASSPFLGPVVTESFLELTWHPGDDEHSGRSVLGSLEPPALESFLLGGDAQALAQASLSASLSAKGVSGRKKENSNSMSGILKQVLEDAGALRRTITFTGKGKGAGKRGGKDASGVSTSTGDVGGETGLTLAKSELRQKLAADKKKSASSSMSLPSVLVGSEDWEWTPSNLDPRSLTPKPVNAEESSSHSEGASSFEGYLVGLLDDVSCGTGSVHGASGVVGSGGQFDLYTPRPLGGGHGAALGWGAWRAARGKGSLTAVARAVASGRPAIGGQIESMDGDSGDLSGTGSMPTVYTRLWAWGRHEHGVLGLGAHALGQGAGVTGSIRVPTPVPFAGDLGGWRVVSLACGWYHTVALTDTGNVYTWGSGADGQLGHGPEAQGIDCPSPRLVDFFGLQHPLRVTAIAAGSDGSGSHTLVVARGLMLDEEAADPEAVSAKAAAVLGDGLVNSTFEGEEAGPGDDADAAGTPGRSLPAAARTGTAVAAYGRVFAWGAGVGVGNGSSTAVAHPVLVRSGASDMYMPAHGGVLALAAGGGFSAVITAAGGAYVWGKYAQGRLGLGTPPESRHQGFNGEKRFLLSSLTPLRMSRGWGWKEAHNAVQGVGGEKGVADSMRPVGAVPNLYGPPTVPIRSIAVGEAHGLAVDVWGLLWAWGRGGGGATGLANTGDALIPHRLTVCAPADDPATGFVLPTAGLGRKGISVFLEEDGSDGGDGEEAFLDAEGGDEATPLVTHTGPSHALDARERSGSVQGSASTIEGRGGVLASTLPARPVRFVRVFAGVGHSLAVDVCGGLWTWGGSGGAMLGHSDEELRSGADLARAAGAVKALSARLRARQANARGAAGQRLKARNEGNGLAFGSTAPSSYKRKEEEEEEEERGAEEENALTEAESVPGAELSFKQPWIVPRRVRSLDGKTGETAIVSAGGGAGHSWAVTRAGRLLVWGKDERGVGVLGRVGRGGNVEGVPRLVGCAGDTLSTITGELPLIGALCAETVTAVGCGAWHTLAVTPLGGSGLATGLRSAWSLASAYAPTRMPALGDTGRGGDGASVSAASTLQPSVAALSSPGVKGFDCVLVVEGGRGELLAHAALVAARVPALAARLAVESMPGRMTRLLLPGLTRAAAVRILEWVYTGGLVLPLGLQPMDVSPGGRASQPNASSGRKSLKEEASLLHPQSLALAAESLGLADLSAVAAIHSEAPLRYWLAALERETAGGQAEAGEDDGASMLVAPPASRVRQAAAGVTLSRSAPSLPTDILRLLLGQVTGPRPVPGLTPYADLLLIVQETQVDAVWAAMAMTTGTLPVRSDKGMPRCAWALPAHTAVVCAASEYLRATLLGPTGSGWDDAAATGALGGGSSTSAPVGETRPGFNGPLELVMPDSPLTVARMLVFLYTGCLPSLPLTASSASDAGVGPTPGLRLPWRRLVKAVESRAEEGEGEGEGEDEEEEDMFVPWEGAPGGVYAVPRTHAPWQPGAQLLLDAGAGERYGLPRLTQLAEACMDVSAEGEGSAAAPSLVVTVSASEALLASLTLPLPRLAEAAAVAALADLPGASRDPAWHNLAYTAPSLVTSLMDRALERNDGFYKILAQEAARTHVPSSKRAVVGAASGPASGLWAVLASLLKGGDGFKLPLLPLIALFLLFISFLSLAEYNASLNEAVPYVNGAALLLAAGMAYYGLLTA